METRFDLFANEIAVRSMTNPLNPFALEYGSILVKENYPASATPPRLALAGCE